MAVASTKTQLPLDRFAMVAGIHPLHFNQVQVDSIAPIGTCAMPLLQYSWQSADRTGREEIAQAIADAEERLQDYLNFALRPTYFADVPTTYPRPANPELYAVSPYDVRGLFRAIHLPQGYLISGGQEAKTPLALGAAITYTDTDGDGYKDTATVTCTNVDPSAQPYTGASPVVDASAVSVYYPGEGADDAWEIRPIAVTIDAIGGTITCTFRREQAVLVDLLMGFSTEGVDGLVDANFLTTVDVYHHWLNPAATQVEFRWEQSPWIAGSGAVQFGIQDGAMLVRDAKLGWADIEAAHWDATSQQYLMDWLNICRMPDNVRTWFRAGWPLDAKGNMDAKWERLVTYLALSTLDRPLCQCETLRTFTEYWAKDFSVSTPENTQQIARRRLENPLGTTRAAVTAWDHIQRYRLPDGGD